MCVNPLTWRTDEDYASRELNQGGLVYVVGETEGAPAVDVGIVDAQCRGGALKVTLPDDERYHPSYAVQSLLGVEVYHIFDYNLFYMNIRRNVADRVAAFLSLRAAASQPATSRPAEVSP